MLTLVYWYGATGGCMTAIVVCALLRTHGVVPLRFLGTWLGYCALFVVCWPVVIWSLARHYASCPEGDSVCSPPQP
jgi:hypothetical protein